MSQEQLGGSNSSTTPPAPKPPMSGWDAPFCVWMSWLALSVTAFAYVSHYGRNVPFNDEYAVVPVLTHHQPVTLSWLWSYNNEHRIPLPRLVLIGLAAVFGVDFRNGMYLTVALMSCLAGLTILAARRVRGSTTYADAFFPLLFLNLGHFENFLWGFQVAFAVSTFLTVNLLLIIVICGDRLVRGPAVFGGICLLLLALCGAQGTLLTPPLAIWFVYQALKGLWTHRLRSASALLTLMLALLALGVVGCYLIGGLPGGYPPPRDFETPLNIALEFVCVGFFGPAVKDVWPYALIAVGLLCATVATSAALAWQSRPKERVSLTGICLYFLGLMALALVVGRGRAFLGPDAGYVSRYALLSAPVACGLYLTAGRFAVPPVTRMVQTGLVVSALLLAMPNGKMAQEQGASYCEKMRAVKSAARKNTPCREIAARITGDGSGWMEVVARSLDDLKHARLGPYNGRSRSALAQ